MATQDPFAGIDFGAAETETGVDPFVGIDFAPAAPPASPLASLPTPFPGIPTLGQAWETTKAAGAALLTPIVSGEEALSAAGVAPPGELESRQEAAFRQAYPVMTRAEAIAKEPVKLAVELLTTPATYLLPGASALPRVLSKAITAGFTGAAAAGVGHAIGEAYDQYLKTGDWSAPEVLGALTRGGIDAAFLPYLVKHLKAGKKPDQALVDAAAELKAELSAQPASAVSGKLETPLPAEPVEPPISLRLGRLERAKAPALGQQELGDQLAYDRAYPGELAVLAPTVPAETIYRGRRQARFPRPPYEPPVIERRFEGGARAPVEIEGGPPVAPSALAALEREGLSGDMEALKPVARTAGATIGREGLRAAFLEPQVGGSAIHWGERGRIVALDGDYVDLRLPDGKLRTVPLDKLTDIQPPRGELPGPPPEEPAVAGPPEEMPGPHAARAEPPPPAYPTSPTTPLEDRLGPGGRIFHPRLGELAIKSAEPDGSFWTRTSEGKLVNVVGDFELLAGDRPRPYELTPEYQQRIIAETPDGAWPIQEAPELAHNLRTSPTNLLVRTLREAKDRFGDDKTPGFSNYPLIDQTEGGGFAVDQYALLWRDRQGRIQGAMAVSGVEGFPPVPPELADAAARWRSGMYTRDDQQAILEWWKTAYHDNPGLRGGEVDVIAVDDKVLPRDLVRAVVRRFQTEVARHRTERKPDHQLTSDGARSLNGQRVKREEMSAAAQAAIWAPDRLAGQVRFSDTGRPLTQAEIVRGLADLAQAADDPAAYGRQFHYEAAALKRFFRDLLKSPGEFERRFGFEVAELPEEAHILAQRRPDGGIDLAIADRRGAPIVREVALAQAEEAAARRGVGGPPEEPAAAAQPREREIPGGPPREPGAGPPAGGERGAELPEAEAGPRLTRINLLDARVRPAEGRSAALTRVSPESIRRIEEAGFRVRRRGVVATEPPKSTGHISFAGTSEFFTVTDSQGAAHIYQAPAAGKLDPSGVRTGARWFGPSNPRTLDRILDIARNFLRFPTEAEAQLAKERIRARRRRQAGELHAGLPLPDLAADMLDIATILGHRGVRAMADYQAWKAQLPESMRVKPERLLRMIHATMLREGIGLAAAQPAIGAPPVEPSQPGAPGTPPAPPSSGIPLGAPGSNVPPIPKYAGSINLHQRLDYGEDALKVIELTQNEFTPLIAEARRGRLTIQAMRKLADNLDLTAEQIRKRRPGTIWRAEKSMAADKILKESAQGAVEMAREYTQTPPMQRTMQQQTDLLSFLQGHVALQASIAGDATEAGRALGIRNRLRYAVGNQKEVQALLDEFGKTRDVRHLDEIARLLSAMNPDDVRAIGRFTKAISRPTTSDKIYEAFLSSILSGIPTHAANALSGLLGLVLKPVEAGAAATVNATLHGAAKLVGYTIPRERLFGEAWHAAKELLPFQIRKLQGSDALEVGVRRGVREAATAALQAFRTEQPVIGSVSKLESERIGAIPGRLGRTVRIPLRALLATDQFTEALIYRMELNAQAYRQAIGEGHRGVEGVARRMTEIVEKPSQVQKDAAVADALYRTFNSPPGSIGESALRLRREHPWLRWFMPFVRTPVNIVKFGYERTPFRTVGQFIAVTRGRGLVTRYRKGEITAGQLSEEGAKTVVGVLLGLAIAEAVSEGYITGGGPADPAKRRTLEATGWSPYSIKLGNSRHGYSRIEPLGVPVGMVADFVETVQMGEEIEPEKLPPQILHALTRNLFDKTWISGIMGILKSIYDWERWGESRSLRTLGSLVPNLIAYGARAGQEERYLPETPGQALAARIPGEPEAISGGFIPHALDIYGRVEKTEPTPFERFVSPIRRSPIRTDAVTPELLRLGIAMDAPSRKLEFTELEQQDLTEQGIPEKLPAREAEILAQARGMAAFIRAAQVLDDPEWPAMTEDEQRDYLHDEIRNAKRDVTLAAKDLVFAETPITLDALIGDLLEESGGPPPLP